MKTGRGASLRRRRCVVQVQHKGGIEMNLVGIRGTGGTELNAVYHRTVLVVLVAGLALLLTRRGRVALEVGWR